LVDRALRGTETSGHPRPDGFGAKRRTHRHDDDYCDALFSSVATVEKMFTSELPANFKTVMIATATKAAINPYSIADTPSSSLRNRTNVSIFRSPPFKVVLVVMAFARLFIKTLQHLDSYSVFSCFSHFLLKSSLCRS
jgi:hypothetical protein